MTSKPTKCIALVDADRYPDIIEMMPPLISVHYDFERTDDRDTDYVSHSCRGYDVLDYSSVRIFITGKNVSPNFNISNYVPAFGKMEFGDHYCRVPLIKF